MMSDHEKGLCRAEDMELLLGWASVCEAYGKVDSDPKAVANEAARRQSLSEFTDEDFARLATRAWKKIRSSQSND